MFKVVINWNYFPEWKFASYFNARSKINCVFFLDYDDYFKYIIDNMEYSHLQKFRLNIYKYALSKKLIKFTKFCDCEVPGDVVIWYTVASEPFELDVDDFAKLLPKTKYKKLYFMYDNLRERYFLKSDFINYIQFHVV